MGDVCLMAVDVVVCICVLIFSCGFYLSWFEVEAVEKFVMIWFRK